MKDSTGDISYGTSEKVANNYMLPSVEENNEDLLQLETNGGFFSRLLSREETTGHSSRIYYRPSNLGRVPFRWEAEPGKRRSSGRYFKEELVDHEMITRPLSPPPFVKAKSTASSCCFSSGRTRAGLLHKIHNYFLQRKKFRRPILCLTNASKVRVEYR